MSIFDEPTALTFRSPVSVATIEICKWLAAFETFSASAVPMFSKVVWMEGKFDRHHIPLMANTAPAAYVGQDRILPMPSKGSGETTFANVHFDVALAFKPEGRMAPFHRASEDVSRVMYELGTARTDFGMPDLFLSHPKIPGAGNMHMRELMAENTAIWLIEFYVELDLKPVDVTYETTLLERFSITVDPPEDTSFFLREGMQD